MKPVTRIICSGSRLLLVRKAEITAVLDWQAFSPSVGASSGLSYVAYRSANLSRSVGSFASNRRLLADDDDRAKSSAKRHCRDHFRPADPVAGRVVSRSRNSR